MKAVVLYESKDLRYEDVATPAVNEHEILVKVAFSGICGSDLPRVLGKAAHYYPIILGHEFSGQVVEIGKDVTHLSGGERIAGVPLVPCGVCADCLQGNYAQCEHYSFIGSRSPGAWADYVKIPETNAVKLPPGVTYEQGAFFEPAAVALHGLLGMNFGGGHEIAIIGAGTIGLLTIQWAKALGARRVFAFDLNEEKLVKAKTCGADVVLDTRKEDFRALVQEETAGRGIDAVVETAGVPFTEILSLEIAANKGTVMYIGTPAGDITFRPGEFECINRKELTVRGSWMSYSAPFPGREWELVGHYLRQGGLTVEPLIDKIIPLREAQAAFHDYEIPGKVKGKILLETGRV